MVGSNGTAGFIRVGEQKMMKDRSAGGRSVREKREDGRII